MMSVQWSSVSLAAPAASFAFHDNWLLSPSAWGQGMCLHLLSPSAFLKEHFQKEDDSNTQADCRRAADTTCNGASWTGISSNFWNGSWNVSLTWTWSSSETLTQIWTWSWLQPTPVGKNLPTSSWTTASGSWEWNEEKVKIDKSSLFIESNATGVEDRC